MGGAGGGTGLGTAGGVVRSKRQTFTIAASNGSSEISVILGVNGFVWIAKNVGAEGQRGQDVGPNRLEESAGGTTYSSQNDEISAATRREIARVAACVRLLAGRKVKVEEELLVRAYEASVELEYEDADADAMELTFGDVSAEAGKRIVDTALHG